MHLNTDELVDIAEGTRSEATAPHLAGCEPCRAQLRDLRAMLSAAKDVDVPEPSPLFWDHLSARISASIADEARRTPASRGAVSFRNGWLPACLALAAGLLIALAVGSRTPAPSSATSPVAAVADAAPASDLLGDVAADNDASLTLVASLTDEVDLDTAREAGLAPRGSAEHAVTHMSDSELRELRRLLKEELAHSGA
jgi:hypothetical protein